MKLLVIPVALLQPWEFDNDDQLIAHEEAERLILEKQETIKQRLKSRFANLAKERSLADELITQRREAGKKEMEA